MSERTVSVKLAMKVRDYVSGADHATAATERLRAAQVGLGSQTKKTASETESFTRAAAQYEKGLSRVGRASAVTIAAMGAAGGSLQLLAPALLGAGAAAGALPGLLGGAAAQMGVLKIAALGVGDAVDKVFKEKDPFARLSPSAAALVNKLGDLKPRLLDMQQSLQERALTGTAGNLDRIARVTLPALETSANRLADNWAVAFTSIADAATDRTVLTGLNTLSRSADGFFDNIITQVRPLSQALATIVIAADPLTRAIGDEVVGALESFTAGVQRAKQSGDLAEFFEAGAQNAQALLSIVGNVITIIDRVVSRVNVQGSALTDLAQSLDTYLASSRSGEDIAGIVDTLTAAYEGLASVVGPLGGVVRDAFADPGTRSAIATFFDVLSAGAQAVRLVFDLFQLLPDPIQAVVLATVALGVVANKTVGGLTALAAAATNAQTRLSTLGAATGGASTKLSGIAGVASKAVTALVALEVVKSIGDQFLPAAANVQALGDALADFAAKGEASGELTRLFGDNLEQLNKEAAAALPGFAADFSRSAENLVPGLRALEESTLGSSATGSVENFQALDAALADYARTTGDAAKTGELYNQILAKSGLNADELNQLLPQSSRALADLQTAAHSGAQSMQTLTERTQTLKGPLSDAVTAGRDLIDVFNELNSPALDFAHAQIAAEEAVDKLREGLGANGRALNQQKTDFDTTTAAGRENLNLTLDLIEKGAATASLRAKETGSLEQGAAVYQQYIQQLRTALAVQGLAPATINAIISRYGALPAALDGAGNAVSSLNAKLNSIPKGTKFTFNGDSIVNGQGQALELKGGLKGIPVGKTFTFNGKSLVDGKGKAYALKQAIDNVPKNPKIVPQVNTAPATSGINAIEHRLNALDGKTATTYIVTKRNFIGPQPPAGLPQARGGVVTPMAAGGVAQIYPASNPPLYQFAEPETGGELFLPRRGDKQRGRQILAAGAQWYGMRVVPLASGGVMAAARGLVNTAPSTTSRGTRLQSAQAYTSARDAVTAFNDSLKQNGRTLSDNTRKGRENRQALYSAVDAAKQAAEAKFAETGSVRLANKAYDEHILRLRRTLAQQKVNAAETRRIMTVAGRPDYGSTVKPSNSLANIAFIKSAAAATEGIGSLRDTLSLNKATVGLGSPEGRENLLAIIGFLEQAASVAQDRYTQTGSQKLATKAYNVLVGDLRKSLSGAGYKKALINSLISQYGRITLTPNATGGIYGGLTQPAAYGPGETLYAFREPSTRGEAFIPRHGGSQQDVERVLSLAAGWRGGAYVPQQVVQSGGGGHSSHMTVNNYSEAYTVAKHQQVQRASDVRNRVGRGK